jgi:nicotinate-nucleotide pyrophosphorylase (carboxylating)
MMKIDPLVALALAEDLPYGDVTTDALIDPAQLGRAIIRPKEDCVLAGLELACQSFRAIDPEISLRLEAAAGDHCKKFQTIMEISGRVSSILKAERIALNFLQRLSGIASLTQKFVEAVKPYPVHIVDTRKTTAGWRKYQKDAVRLGGGRNHRFSLSDGILIKNNHITAAGGVKLAVEKARSAAPHTLKIEVEVRNQAELEEALAARADIIMLDNMTPAEIEQSVQLVAKRALLEVSGGITLSTVRAMASCGVDLISIGALTHSSTSTDIHLLLMAD